MSNFDDDSRVMPAVPQTGGATAADSFTGQVQPHWNIGANPNGGY